MFVCSDTSDGRVERLHLDRSGIRVPQSLTELPPRELLEKTLHESVRRARERLSIEGRQTPADDPRDRPTPARSTRKPPKRRRP
ncbi:hypothetical protein [Aquisphaera insulae]|uniref:hypothetical protein n=1 Tax=Aquisphaera insulae TaxID=2712864 RepID=UPI0013EC68A9|nr:hypothetical protein [Aquisphaera insulae]